MPLPQRKPTRHKDFDYAHDGAYFVTICTHERDHLFGEIHNGVMKCNDWGDIANAAWIETAKVRPNIEIDDFVVMPNHIDAIVVIRSSDHAGLARQTPTAVYSKPITGALGTIVGAYKASVTRNINQLREARTPIWQRNYHDHVIRNEQDLNRIREYVASNPERWADDVFNRPESP